VRGIYWKIYLTFIITSVLAAGVTLAYAVLYRQISNETNNLIAPTEGYISAAQLMLQRGGEPLLIEWLLTFEEHSSVNAYVFDDQGQDLLGNAPRSVLKYGLAADDLNIKIQPLSRSEVLVKAPILSLQGQYYLLVVEFLHPFVVMDAKSYIYLGLGFAILIFAGFGFLLSAYLSRPMRKLQKTVKAISEGDLSARSGPRLKARKDEIGDLSREFDLMADRLQNLLADQKLLLRDISHELRSPLARLQIALELARLDANDEVLEHLDRIELETERVNEQIADILMLAKLEVERHPEQWQSINLVDVLEEIAADAQFEQQGDHIELTSLSSFCLVHADYRMLRSAFENLIPNALLHTYKGTRVEVSVSKEGERFAVVVRDHGPGVADEHIEHLTKPFYRAENARQRSASQGSAAGSRGYGLGLAIAYRVIRSFAGEMSIRNHPQGGLEIRCVLPQLSID